jgi:hypothetical protein
MQSTTELSEVEEYLEAFVKAAIARITTQEELQRFLFACDSKIALADDDRLRKLLVECEECVFLALSRFHIMSNA